MVYFFHIIGRLAKIPCTKFIFFDSIHIQVSSFDSSLKWTWKNALGENVALHWQARSGFLHSSLVLVVFPFSQNIDLMRIRMEAKREPTYNALLCFVTSFLKHFGCGGVSSYLGFFRIEQKTRTIKINYSKLRKYW